MNLLPYIDLFAHSEGMGKDTVAVCTIFPGDPIPAFSGRNFYSAGLSPSSLKDKNKNNEWLIIMEDALEFDHIIFVGPCGIDKDAVTGIDEQKRVFEAQAFMAEEYQKPLLINCGGFFSGIIEIHNKISPVQPWILHSYDGNVEATAVFLKRNFLFSFGERLLISEKELTETFSLIPYEKIFFETNEFKGDISNIYKKGSEIKNISPDEMVQIVWDNFNRLEKVSFNDLA
ncbi:MAG: TatD family hydrolase [Prolixibacteraceae bacterium]|jgi:TatD DNase family protein|nr:TatD family hydrolase [Prolixibacteraceae bacterium]